MTRDNIFATINDNGGDFKFDDKVSAVFADMIRRSVPGYENIISMLSTLAARFATPDSNCYDLGASLGASAIAIRNGIKAPGCRIFAVDNSPHMIAKCRENTASSSLPTPIETICDDIRNIQFTRASIVVLNFTLQFLPTQDRLPLLAKIRQAMLPGAVLVLSEKITHHNPFTRQLLIDVYHDWKRSNGYSDLEISRKRSALENVLIPETIDSHRERLQLAGFSHSEQWFQCFNFISILAFP